MKLKLCEDKEMIQTILTIIFSGAFFSFIQFLITRKDNKDDKFKSLESEFKKGLDERERTGKNRYDEHKNAINAIKLQHQEDFQKLNEAIKQLTENDTKIAALIEDNQSTTCVIASGVVGIIHNTIIHSTQQIIDRGAVTYQELNTLDSLYIPYAKLGGNGDCQRRYNDIVKLPVISDEEALKRDKVIAANKQKELQEAIGA